jgi:pimeloyl-ACP methyl ester carboxylesterase
MIETRTGAFNDLVTQPETHVALDLSGNARSLLVLFGGIAGGVSMPVFEFFRLTAGMPGKKAFLRDPRRGWYQLGLPGVGPTAQDVRRYLDQVIAEADVDRVVMAGASAGGYAAMLFGAWCGADYVLAFSPQTFIDAANRASAGDSRWAPQIDHLHAVNPSGAVYDLHKVLAASAGPRTALHVSNDDPLDLIHARRVADLPNVAITEHDQGGHRLVKTLRDRGILGPVLQDALRLPDSPTDLGE